MDNPILTALLVTLADARRKEQEAAKAKQAWLEAQDQLKVLEAEHNFTKARLILAEEATRKAALEIFASTGDTKPHRFISIKKFRHFEYDRVGMTLWCKKNAPALLTLNDRAFEAFIRSPIQVELPPGVIVVDEHKATIARDLSDLQGPLQ